MIEAFIEQRQSPRVGYKVPLTLRFHEKETDIAQTETNNISAGGIQFTVPNELQNLNEGSIMNFTFSLPNLGEVSAKGQIRYILTVLNDKFEALKICGVKFVDISREVWQFLLNYSAAELEKEKNGPVINRKSKDEFLGLNMDYAISTSIKGTLTIEGGLAIPCTILDANYGGLKLRVHDKTSFISYNISGTVSFSYRNKNYELPGTIALLQPKNDLKGNLYGLTFHDLTPEQFDGLREFILALSYIK